MGRKESKGRSRLVAVMRTADCAYDRADRPEIDVINAILAKLLLKSNWRLSNKSTMTMVWILHHAATSTTQLHAAYVLASRLRVQGVTSASWVAVVAYDRLRVMQGRPQRFGTQYHLSQDGSRWDLYWWEEKESDRWRTLAGLPPASSVPRSLPRGQLRGPGS